MVKTIVYVKYTDDNHEFITVQHGRSVDVQDGAVTFMAEEDSALVRIPLCNTFRVDVFQDEVEE